MFEPEATVAGPDFEIVRPAAKPGGRKRTAPAPRPPPSPITAACTVAPAAVKGAWMNAAGACAPTLLPVTIASWLSALIPTSSKPGSEVRAAGNGICSKDDVPEKGDEIA